MKKEEIKKDIAITMYDVIMGDENPQSGIKEIEDILKDVEEVKEFAELALHATKNYINKL